MICERITLSPRQADAMVDTPLDYEHMFDGKCALIFVVDVLEDYRVSFTCFLIFNIQNI